MNLTPLAFEDSGEVYKKLAEIYIKHSVGYFVLAPSGAGKTHFCKHQAEPHWIDGDDLWLAAKAHPRTDWWNHGIEVINRIDQRSDAITMEAKHEGFWVMGASNFWLKPDAIVIPDWETQKRYIAYREEHDYDGGATSDKLDQVQSHIEFIKSWHEKQGVPMFESIQEAADYLADKLG